MTTAAASSPRAGVPAAGNPFPGPRPYGADQADLFFGRERQVEELVSLVLSSRIVLVHAPSGYGKSSLLEAGLLPRLREEDVTVLPTVRLGQAQTRPAPEQTDPFVPLLEEALRAGGEGPSGGRASALRLLLVDQFEEVFLDPALWEERAAFLDHVRRTVEGDDLLRVVLAMRSDFLADLLPLSASLPNRLVVRFGLDSLDEPQARHAVAEAFRRTGVPLSAEQLDRLLDALLTLPPTGGHGKPVRGQHVNLVQLQVLCRRLWDELAATDGAPAHDLLDLRASMRHFVDAAVSGVARETGAGEGLLRRWVEDNLITAGDRRAVLPLEESDAGGLPVRVVRALERARLVQVEQRNRARWVELTHDSMVGAVQESNAAWATRWRRRRRGRTALAGLLVLLLLGAVPVHASHLSPAVQRVSGSGDGELLLAADAAGPVALRADWYAAGEQDGAQVTVWAQDGSGDQEEVLATRTVQVPGYAQRVLLVRTAPTTSRYAVRVEAAPDVQYELTLERLDATVARPERDVRLPLTGRPTAVATQPGDLLQVEGDAEVLAGLTVIGGTVLGQGPPGGAVRLQAQGQHVLLDHAGPRAVTVGLSLVAVGRDLSAGAEATVLLDEVALVRVQEPPAPSLVTAWCSAPAQVGVLDQDGVAVETYRYGGATSQAARALVGAGRTYQLLLERPAGAAGTAECRVRVDEVPAPTGRAGTR